VLLLAFGIAPAREARAQTAGTYDEARVKAVYLVKFAEYVDWPSSAFATAGSPIVIGVAGDDAVASHLEDIVIGRRLRGHPFSVRRLDAPGAVGAMQMLYVGGEDSARVTRYVRAVRRRPVLTVAGVDDGLDAGVVINFVLKEDRVRFEISTEAAEKNGLALSSRLLAVALRVLKGGLDGGSLLARMLLTPAREHALRGLTPARALGA
jgi:hypothetical protein